jgi:hypothetical protein
VTIANGACTYTIINAATTTLIGPPQGGVLVFDVSVITAWTGGTVQLLDGGVAFTPTAATTATGLVSTGLPDSPGMQTKGQLSVVTTGTPGSLVVFWSPY